MPVAWSGSRLREFFRYAVVGLSSTVIDFGIFALLTDIGSWTPLSANPVSFTLGVTNGFYWNRHWTFPRSRREAALGHYARFVLVNRAGVLIDQSVLALALALGPMAGLDPRTAKWTGKVLSIPFVAAWNFTVNARWTFRSRNLPDAAQISKHRESVL